MIVPYSDKPCALCFHVGRLNLRMGPYTYQTCLEVMKIWTPKKSQFEMLEDLKTKMDWNDDYDRETLEAIEDEEFWFKIEHNYEDPLLTKEDRMLSPRVRWQIYKDFIDENHLLALKQRSSSI